MKAKEITKWRNIWMAIAMLWMVWLHSGLVVNNDILMLIKGWGYGGVDIFLFASGLGCYYSLEKNSDVVEFIKRRVARIIPTYWLFLIVWVIFRRMTTGISNEAIIGNFLCVQTFTNFGSDFNWYISAIWLLYFLAPFFYGIVKRYNSVWQYIGMFVLLLAVSIPFWNARTYIIMITRIPIFFIGMILGKTAKEDITIRKSIISLLVLLMCGGIWMLYYSYQTFPEKLWGYGLHWYPFILIVPGLCVLISFVMQIISTIPILKNLEKVLSVVGKYSFEIYLVHAFLYEVYRAVVVSNNPKYDGNLYWCLVILMIIPASFLFIGLNRGVNVVGQKIINSMK